MEPASKRRKRSTTSTTTTNDAEKADAAAEVGGSATIPSSGQSLLQNFALLPHELRIRIVKLACSLPSSSSATNHADNPPAASQGASTLTPSTSATPGVDTTTTLSLVRVSRSLYALATPIIFSHIWLTRASQVVELQRALAARPQLGYLVQSLHIGPDDELPHHCYPLHDRPCYDYRYPSNSSQHFDEHHMWIITSLRGSLGAQLRPHWCDDDTDWSLEREFELNCREMAVFKADVAAQRALDVNLLVEGSTMSGGTISVEKWTVRAYEVQAAHDLYLMHMRALEDSHTTAAGPSCPRRGCNRGPCPVYPPLHLEATPDAPQHDDDDKTLPAAQPFVLTRSQLLRHLARPGSITDRLDHPLLFARSGVDLVERATRFGSARFHRRSEFAAMPDNFAELSSMEDRINEHDSSSASSSAGVLDPTLPFAQTLGTILTLVRSIFCFTPLLRSLSLTGFLDRATSQLSSLSLAQLRHFSLGPPPPAWYWPLGFHKLASLHSLRVCGVELDSNEAIGIAVNTQTLRHLSISMAAKWHNSAEDSAHFSPTLAHIVGILKGDRATDSVFGRQVSDLREQLQSLTKSLKRKMAGLEDEDDEDFDEMSLPLYELKLHPDDVKSLLDGAPSPEAREAWREGRALSREDHCRLLLVESEAAAEGRWEGVACTSSAELYAEGREWWETHAGLRGAA